ncbi:hypothetical protein pCPXV0216 [Cowpox virus]|nr:putative E ORF A [Vaccinia virus Copenhagen]AAF33910.1 unknown [Vaccinia virus Tian Tan]AAW23459.1 hypothetical protein m8066L [Vaccinia virus]ABZ79972.1 unknown [synthetic Vaccinia virus]CAB5514021.1 hypothetical protein pCPXV0216 [Cowpox virus]BBD06117.1 putative E ORF A [BAC cloning vector pLC16m8.8S-BAC]
MSVLINGTCFPGLFILSHLDGDEGLLSHAGDEGLSTLSTQEALLPSHSTVLTSHTLTAFRTRYLPSLVLI